MLRRVTRACLHIFLLVCLFAFHVKEEDCEQSLPPVTPVGQHIVNADDSFVICCLREKHAYLRPLLMDACRAQ